jgi:hypothetical protein
MERIDMNRNAVVGVSIFGLAAILGAGSAFVKSEKAVVHAAGVMVPKFEADPYWPKPLPNHWVIGQTIGVSMDTHDDVWIIHRPGTLERMESYATRGDGDCCTAAPDVLEFDPAGNLIRHWGKAEGHDWPSSNHGITVDKDGNVWLGANGPGQPGPAPGSAEQFAVRPGAAPAPPRAAAEGGAPRNTTYHDSFILKFTQDGKFLGEIGTANGSKGSLDTDNVRGVAQIRIIPQTNELVAADGYGNHRVSVWDPQTLKFKRMWGAYGKAPSDDPIPRYNPDSPQFGNPVHCAEPTSDGYIYVCDRTNDRIQIFKDDGTYVKQVVLEPNTKGDGAPWEIAFSRDPQQKYMYVADGSNEKIHVFDRESMKELYWFGGGGRQPGQFYAVHSIVTDTHGNIFTTETYRGQRVQKFTYKGLVSLDSLLKEKMVGNSQVEQP